MLNAWILGWVSDAIVAHPVGSLGRADLPSAPEHARLLRAPARRRVLRGAGLLAHRQRRPHLQRRVPGRLRVRRLRDVRRWCARLTGRDDAAVVAGVLFACSPYLTSSQVARVQMLTCGWSALTPGGAAPLHRHRRTPGGGRASSRAGRCRRSSNMYLGVFLALPIGVVARPRDHGATAAAVGGPRSATSSPAGWCSPSCWRRCCSSTTACRTTWASATGSTTVQRYSADVRSYLSVWIDRQPALLVAEISADRALYPGAAVLAAGGRGGCGPRAAAGSTRRRGRRWASTPPSPSPPSSLSLGPVPSAWERPLGIGSPYGALLDLVPGFDGFRAPARFALPVLMALAVLAGCAVAGLAGAAPARRRRGDRRGRWRCRCGRAGAIFPWVETVPPEDPSTTAAYAWLADQPAGPVLKLPITTHFQAQRPDAGALGDAALPAGGAAPPASAHQRQLRLRDAVRDAVPGRRRRRSPRSTRSTTRCGIVRAIGGRYVVVHLHEYRTTRAPTSRRCSSACAPTPRRSRACATSASTLVLTLTAGAAGASRRPRRASCRATRLRGVGVAQSRPPVAPGRRRPDSRWSGAAARRHVDRGAVAPGPGGRTA